MGRRLSVFRNLSKDHEYYFARRRVEVLADLFEEGEIFPKGLEEAKNGRKRLKNSKSGKPRGRFLRSQYPGQAVGNV